MKKKKKKIFKINMKLKKKKKKGKKEKENKSKKKKTRKNFLKSLQNVVENTCIAASFLTKLRTTSKRDSGN